MTHISSLTLNGFRNYESASINGIGEKFVILIGDNGAGKTNCLEAISILSPGRGLRGASASDYQSHTKKSPWVVSADIKDSEGDILRLGVGRSPQNPDRKIIRANGTPIKNQDELGDILRTIWLTPQMDGLFLQGSTERRRFFDRLVATFDGGHTGRMVRIEKATRERLNLLRSAAETGQRADDTWLNALENIMAETSVAIAAARLDTLKNLEQALHTDIHPLFPKPALSLDGAIEKLLNCQSALQVEDYTKEQLQKLRSSDGQTGRTNFGIHKTDMVVTYTDKNVNATLSSTGEQKALLTSIILAHARMVNARYGIPPLLLFDEVCAHFDEMRRDSLFEILGNLGGQVWLSGQDANDFIKINMKSMLTIKNNQFV